MCHRKVINIESRTTTRSGWVLPSAASAGISGLRWSAWLSTTAPASTNLRVRFGVPSRCWSINSCVLSRSQQPPQQKDDDFCTACLTGVCLCCALEGGWLPGLRLHHVLKISGSTLQLPFLTSVSVSTCRADDLEISAFVNDNMTSSSWDGFCCTISSAVYLLYKVGYETLLIYYAFCMLLDYH